MPAGQGMILLIRATVHPTETVITSFTPEYGAATIFDTISFSVTVSCIDSVEVPTGTVDIINLNDGYTIGSGVLSLFAPGIATINFILDAGDYNLFASYPGVPDSFGPSISETQNYPVTDR